MHHGGMGWAPAQLLAYSAVHKNKKPYPCKKSVVILPKRYKREIKKTLSWEFGDVVTVANAVPQPNGHDPERGEVRRRAGWTLTTVTMPPPDVNPSADQKDRHQD